MGAARGEWSAATQRRIGVTKSMLNDMKSINMMGLTDLANGFVQEERVRETKKMETMNWAVVWKNVVGEDLSFPLFMGSCFLLLIRIRANNPLVAAPAATFAVYAIQDYLYGRSTFDTAKAFTSLALITLVTDPACILLFAGPNIYSSMGCFDRIQKFLLSEPRIDGRISAISDAKESSGTANGNLNASNHNNHSNGEQTFAIKLENVRVRPAKQAEVAVHVPSLSIAHGSTTMIVGPVGSGKTTLLKAILGELPVDQGTITVSTKKLAYCAQTPWLPNGTLREAILGFGSETEVDEQWYDTVVDACSLVHDFTIFPAGDNTKIGSRGVSLSGGQRQRIALARALYSRAEILVLDDVLSALDKTTEKAVIRSLFDKDGILQRFGATVILVTHAGKHRFLNVEDQAYKAF